jgi:Flp pilus assembly pilin Flp
MMDRTAPWRRKVGAARQRGQAMLEYALIGGVLASAMFLVDYGGGKTGAQYLTDMIRAFFRNLTYYLSLP